MLLRKCTSPHLISIKQESCRLEMAFQLVTNTNQIYLNFLSFIIFLAFDVAAWNLEPGRHLRLYLRSTRRGVGMNAGRCVVLLGQAPTFLGRISIFWPKVAFQHVRMHGPACRLLQSEGQERKSIFSTFSVIVDREGLRSRSPLLFSSPFGAATR